MDENAWAGFSRLRRAVWVLEEEGALGYEEFRDKIKIFCEKFSDSRALVRILLLRNLIYRRCGETGETEGTSRCVYAATKIGKKLALGVREEVERLLLRKMKMKEKKGKRMLKLNLNKKKGKDLAANNFTKKGKVSAVANSRLWTKILGEVFAKDFLFAEIPTLSFLQKAKTLACQQSDFPDDPFFLAGGILKAMIKDRLLEEKNERVCLTEKGRLVLRNAFGWGGELCRREKRYKKLKLKAKELGMENIACGVRKLKKLVRLAQRGFLPQAA